jgi:anti-anti-sigma factor
MRIESMRLLSYKRPGLLRKTPAAAPGYTFVRNFYTFVIHAKRFIPYTYPTMFNDAPLSIERADGKAPGTVIFRFTGPITLRNQFGMRDQLRASEPPALTILDLSGVPYMDSTGMGAVINHYVHCQNRGVRMIVAGVNSRVMELFKVMKVDTVIPLVVTLEEAEGKA